MGMSDKSIPLKRLLAAHFVRPSSVGNNTILQPGESRPSEMHAKLTSPSQAGDVRQLD